jgi:vacuolar-type H+-ATPase subunit I/STV1
MEDKQWRMQAELSGHHDCVNEIRRARSIRGMQVASEDNLELLQMRAEIQDLTRRSSQLVESIASKEEFIADKLKNSQEYVARSEQIAQMLTSATTTEQLDKLGRESDQVRIFVACL